MVRSMVERTPKQRGLDVLIPTLVVAIHAAVRDETVVVWGVEALPKYGEEMVLMDLVVKEIRCKMHLKILR